MTEDARVMAVSADNLTKRYGEHLAVDGVSPRVREGEVYGFLGRKGAGKTTTLRMALGLIRLTLAQGTTVFLLGGCLTLGVLGAARCLLDAERGARSVGYVTEQVGDADFVVVTEARRVGGLTDVADLTMVSPLVLLARRTNDPFTAVIDNSDRYPYRPNPERNPESR